VLKQKHEKGNPQALKMTRPCSVPFDVRENKAQEQQYDAYHMEHQGDLPEIEIG
jgi:hypothetical protein